MWILTSRTCNTGASHKFVILCTGEIIALNTVHPHSWLFLSPKKRFTTRRKRQQANPKDILNCISLLYLPKQYNLNTCFHCYTTSTGPGLIRVSYNHWYVPVSIRGSKPGCTATAVFIATFKHAVYGCETRSLTLREEHRLRVFENRVLRRIFGPKRDEVTGGWRKLHNEELRNLYSSTSTIRKTKSRTMRWTGRVARMGETRNAHRILSGLWFQWIVDGYYRLGAPSQNFSAKRDRPCRRPLRPSWM
jgi:hypothetical protein